MIVDLPRFLKAERVYWDELEGALTRLESEPGAGLRLDEARRLHYLYERTLSDLAKISTFSAEPEVRAYLESLVARAYGEINETRGKRNRFQPVTWFIRTFPRTFRRHIQPFWFTLALTFAGVGFGCLALAIDKDAKKVVLPFSHLMGDPKDRVKEEESRRNLALEGGKASFSASLMTHNIKVSLVTMALGMTWGVGTMTSLFYNGVILGAVCWDYVMAGQTRFLMGWLLPHGSVEIPAILLAGQAGFMLAGALIGWGSRKSRARRMREIAPDLVTIVGGAACLLVWAGIVESFFSQYHEPVIPYALKIAFGSLQLAALVVFLWRCGVKGDDSIASL